MACRKRSGEQGYAGGDDPQDAVVSNVHEMFVELTGRLNYPMLLVTAAADGKRSGCLVGFSTQCSIDPARFVVCLSDKNHTTRVAAAADALAVHFPPAEAVGLAELFGSQTGDEIDKFSRCQWHTGPLGVPIVDACRRWFVGTIVERRKLGDHVAFVLEPVDARDDGGNDTLTFSDVKHLEPGHDA
jgi:flavin reductase (DIM6/NTAB) family NADH-FMN oxidoreductase RutF